MNFRTTYILLAIVVLGFGGLGIYVLSTGDKKTSLAAEGYVLKALRSANVKPDDVTSLEIELPGQTPDKLVFTRDGRNWVLAAPSRARVDSAAVDSIITGVLNAKTDKTATLSNKLGAHGLDNPPLKVTIKTDKLSESVSLGNVTIGGERAVVYVTTSDKPYAARRSDFNALFKTDAPKGASNAGQLAKNITDFRPLKLIGDGIMDPTNQVRSMAVRAGKDELALFREPGGAWKFRLPADYGEAATDGGTGKDSGNINSVRELLNTITNIQPANRSSIIETPGDLSKYGLDGAKSNPMQIDLSRDDGIKESVFVGGPIKAGGKDVPDKYYARHEVDSVVYEVPAEPVKKILAAMANKNALRDRAVLRIMPGRVDAIDIETAGDKIELRKIGFGWQVFDAEGKGRPANPRAVNELLDRLAARQLADSFPPPDVPEAKRGFEKPLADVKLWEGGIVPDAKADPKAKPKVNPTPTARMIFGLQDVGDVVFARRILGETKADFFLPADVFKLASRGRMEYLDATIKPIDRDKVLKLSFTQGKDIFELERADDTKQTGEATWKINSPPRLKGRAADPLKVFHLLSYISLWAPKRVVSDKVTEDVLNRLEIGTTNTRLKITATIKDGGERVFLFGGDVGTEKKFVYLKPGDQDLVVEVDRDPFEHYQKADVLDTTVHRIDKTKLKAIKITGWQEVLGTPTTLEIERKEGKWTLKSGGIFELDPRKVDDFLNELTTPKAESFVVYKEGAKPEHNLDVAKNALLIEMIQETGDPVKLAISPPNKEGKVFATTSALPGDVFILADRFAQVRAKPAALKKD